MVSRILTQVVGCFHRVPVPVTQPSSQSSMSLDQTDTHQTSLDPFCHWNHSRSPLARLNQFASPGPLSPLLGERGPGLVRHLARRASGERCCHQVRADLQLGRSIGRPVDRRATRYGPLDRLADADRDHLVSQETRGSKASMGPRLSTGRVAPS
jgi:hypothetical protein